MQGADDTSRPGESAPIRRLPKWLQRPVGEPGQATAVEKTLLGLDLSTVCHSAKCPNRAECFSSGTATFLVGGATCARSCSFCAVDTAAALPLDVSEPQRIAKACVALGLTYVVLTMVSRDDLPDGAAAHMAAVVSAVRKALPEAGVEVLTSDFAGSTASVDVVIAAGPVAFAHNLETVRRLYPSVRPQADYERSLGILEHVVAVAGDSTAVKSGFMVGLGETDAEIEGAMRDLRQTRATILTVGQYLQPTPKHAPIHRFLEPSEFENIKERALALGFEKVASAPFVRSSYRADRMVEQVASTLRCTP
ncbi:MAG: lipoyl synthase [Actinobacteria bacterium]|nr:lipoyl synthase [Actinomycetota bacterium]